MIPHERIGARGRFSIDLFRLQKASEREAHLSRCDYLAPVAARRGIYAAPRRNH